jgi:hypothetical protein
MKTRTLLARKFSTTLVGKSVNTIGQLSVSQRFYSCRQDLLYKRTKSAMVRRRTTRSCSRYLDLKLCVVSRTSARHTKCDRTTRTRSSLQRTKCNWKKN